ncbi:virus assembly crescent formation protein [Cotia virus SPAn232]|uniref:Virus assembly crescent formation protein n=2 Tax=Cotia virus TaxID=39444 RepID=H6TA36_9POXV|nr:virus assembly crescent formation protein [Cotia virus SPAn232]ADT91076.1 virus assembly crescent formation protein [Cotia virus SPAn232]AIT70675.1 virus assembly crescent formation protein [Cotia virus]
MDKLYAAIFGVFMSSTDDEFYKFIEVVKSVLSDGDNNSNKNKIQKSFFNFNILLGLAIFILLILFVVIFYLKVVRMT